MTRRAWLAAFALPAKALADSGIEVVVPVHRVTDSRSRLRPERWQYFWSVVWPEAYRCFARIGIHLEITDERGEIRRSPANQPDIRGLRHGALNLVLTDRIPIVWDAGRGLSGVTTRYRGFHLCMIAMARAHGHQIPFMSLNTCVHELLHALMQDIYEPRPAGWTGEARELLVDVYGTRMWLLNEGSTLRRVARGYVERLRLGVISASAS